LIINNTISNNNSSCGSGIYCRGGSNPVIINAIFWNNLTNAIYFSQFGEPGTMTIAYSLIEGGKENVIFNDNGYIRWLNGNIDCDPLFRDIDNNDFHLADTYCGDPSRSPCIDAGRPDLLDSILDCDRGLGTARSDMGAYGGGDSVGVHVDGLTYQTPKRVIWSRNYPNPFNESTVIEYRLNLQSMVTIDIFDILGRKLATLANRQQPSGINQAIWKADNFSSGVYFYRLQAGEFAESKAISLLK